MESIPKILMEAGIFKPEDIYIFCESKNRGWRLDTLDILYNIRNEEDIWQGLLFDINFIRENELLEILACSRISDYCFELVLRVRDGEGSEVEEKTYLHRILTLQERIQEAHQLYNK